MESVARPLVPAYRFGWLYGRTTDLFIFVLPFLVTTLLCLAASDQFILAASAALIMTELGPILGSFHAGATWFHYLDSDNRTFYTRDFISWLKFILVPLAIVPLTVFGWFTFPIPTYFVFMVWTIQHLVQQNVGILLLYRCPGDAQVPRLVEARTLQVAAGGCGIIYLYRIATHPGPAAQAALLVAGIMFLSAVMGFYLFELHKASRSGATINLAALIFWVVNVITWGTLLIGPLAFAMAMVLPLTVHWCQYIGLNYVLVSRKYGQLDNAQRLPISVVLPIVLFFGCCLVAMALLWALDAGSQSTLIPDTAKLLQSLVLGASMCHYFQDAFTWRFREPFLRENILPFVRSR